jgi:exonuclease VII large subunit
MLIEQVMEFAYRLDDMSRTVVHHARSNCALALSELRDYARRARRAPSTALARELAAVERHRGRAEELGTRTVKQAAAVLDGTEHTLVAAGGRLARTEGRRLDASEARLRALDPVRVLERGYTITRDPERRVVKRAAGLSAGDTILTQFADGAATSTVDDVDREEEHEEVESEAESRDA